MRSIVVVIPCFNEEARLPSAEFREFIRSREDVVLWFVNDGSTDATSSVLNGLRSAHPGRVRVLELAVNCGKAEAVRRGVQDALRDSKAGYIGYFDADLATPLPEVFRLLVHMDQSGAIMAFASRVKRLGIRLERSGIRHYLGRVFATEASFLLGLPVYDTQCGAKLFKRELAAQVFDRPFISRWFFDVEIFFRLIQRLGRARVEREVVEVPVSSWLEKGQTKVRLTDFVKAPFELIRIWMRYRTAQVANRPE